MPEKKPASVDKAIVVLSGGQDSTTALYWAREQFQEVHCITFDYGQRHKIEIESAKKIASMAGVASHEVLEVGSILKGTSPLVDPTREVGHYDSVNALPGGIEPTFVPCRNALFLTIAANRAVALGCRNVVTGICEADYGGYPDCRNEFLVRMKDTLSYAIFGRPHELLFHNPLLTLTKAESVAVANKLPGCMEALAFSHSCYDGEYPPNPSNHASLLRARGFFEAGLSDPLIVRAKQEGKLPTDYPDTGLVEGTKYAKPVEHPDDAASGEHAAKADKKSKKKPE